MMSDAITVSSRCNARVDVSIWACPRPMGATGPLSGRGGAVAQHQVERMNE